MRLNFEQRCDSVYNKVQIIVLHFFSAPVSEDWSPASLRTSPRLSIIQVRRAVTRVGRCIGLDQTSRARGDSPNTLTRLVKI